MKTDQFEAPDYYLLDDLLTDEQKLIRDTARAWVKKEISPIIDDYYERAEFPSQIIKDLGRNFCFCSSDPYFQIGYMTNELCTEAVDLIPESALSSSCISKPYEI
jgi:hypothetical protein